MTLDEAKANLLAAKRALHKAEDEYDEESGDVRACNRAIIKEGECVRALWDMIPDKDEARKILSELERQSNEPAADVKA